MVEQELLRCFKIIEESANALSKVVVAPKQNLRNENNPLAAMNLEKIDASIMESATSLIQTASALLQVSSLVNLRLTWLVLRTSTEGTCCRKAAGTLQGRPDLGQRPHLWYDVANAVLTLSLAEGGVVRAGARVLGQPHRVH